MILPSKKSVIAMTQAVVVILVATMLTACGFHLRNASHVPSQLHTITFIPLNPYSSLSTRIKALLTSLHIAVRSPKQKSPIQLVILENSFSHNSPTITTSSIAVTYTYILAVEAELETASGKAIGPHFSTRLTASYTFTPSQIYAPNAASLVKRQLEREAISNMYFWLISGNMHTALSKHFPIHKGLPHASAAKKTRHIS